MTHDSLCPVDSNPEWDECVHCELIAKVREDEHTNHCRDHACQGCQGLQPDEVLLVELSKIVDNYEEGER